MKDCFFLLLFILSFMNIQCTAKETDVDKLQTKWVVHFSWEDFSEISNNELTNFYSKIFLQRMIPWLFHFTYQKVHILITYCVTVHLHSSIYNCQIFKERKLHPNCVLCVHFIVNFSKKWKEGKCMWMLFLLRLLKKEKVPTTQGHVPDQCLVRVARVRVSESE